MFDDRQQTVERNRFIKRINVAFKHRIDRDKVVIAVDLYAVTGVVNDRDFGVARLIGEIAQRTAHLVCFEIATKVYNIKACPLQHADIAAESLQDWQPGGLLIGRISDHQSHPLLGECRLAKKAKSEKR